MASWAGETLATDILSDVDLVRSLLQGCHIRLAPALGGKLSDRKKENKYAYYDFTVFIFHFSEVEVHVMAEGCNSGATLNHISNH